MESVFPTTSKAVNRLGILLFIWFINSRIGLNDGKNVMLYTYLHLFKLSV